MTLLIDEIHKFYSTPQNVKDFEEWKARKYKNDDTSTKSERKTS